MPAFRELVLLLFSPAAIAALAAVGLPACGDCTSTSEARGATGAFSLTTGDAARFETSPREATDFRVEKDTITVTAKLAGAGGDARTVVVTVPAHVGDTGTFALDPAKTPACVVESPGYPDVCVPLAGTLVVRASALDCSGNGSGVSFCTDTLDAHLTASGDASGVHVTADLALVATPVKTQSACKD